MNGERENRKSRTIDAGVKLVVSASFPFKDQIVLKWLNIALT